METWCEKQTTRSPYVRGDYHVYYRVLEEGCVLFCCAGGARYSPRRAEERFRFCGVYRFPAGATKSAVALFRLRDKEDVEKRKREERTEEIIKEEWLTAAELCEAGDTLLRACPELGTVQPGDRVPEIAFSPPVSPLYGPKPPFCFARTPTPNASQRILVFDPSIDASHPHFTWTSTHVLCAGARAFLVAP